MRLLLAVKDHEVQQALVAYLLARGFCVDQCDSGRAVMEYQGSFEYDVLLVGAELADMGGIDLVRQIRERDDLTPVLLMGPDTGPEERVRGLTVGADDFLIWPFALEEMVARIHVQTRRQAGRATNVFTAADLTVDCNTRQAMRGGHTIALTAREFAILECLIVHKGMVLTRAQIEDHVWSTGYDGGSNVVDVYISYLRRKIDGPNQIRLITTVRGKGYMLRES